MLGSPREARSAIVTSFASVYGSYLAKIMPDENYGEEKNSQGRVGDVFH